MQVAAATPLKPHNGTFRKGTQEQREPKMISPLLVLSFLLLPTSFVSSDVAFPLQVNLWFSQRKEQTRNFQTSKTYEKMWTNQYLCWKPGHINQTYLCCKAGHIYQYLNTTTRLAARHICQYFSYQAGQVGRRMVTVDATGERIKLACVNWCLDFLINVIWFGMMWWRRQSTLRCRAKISVSWRVRISKETNIKLGFNAFLNVSWRIRILKGK